MIQPILALFLFGQTQATTPLYTQSVTTADGVVQMKTLCQQLVRDGKPDIWLVGAVHIGSKAYYSSLQGILDQEEVVLYEGVKSDEQKKKAEPPKKVEGETTDRPIYKVLSDALGLEFQLNAVNYDHANWVNCDLTWEEMDKVSKEAGNGDKGGTYGQIKQLLDPKSPQSKMFATMMDTATPGTKEAIKLMIVKSVASGEVGLDDTTDKIVIKARNQVVLDSLAKSIASDKPPKSIAVFYGAKHLPSMEADLEKTYGYKPGKQEWFMAAEADPKKVDSNGQMLLDMLDKQKKPRSGGGGLFLSETARNVALSFRFLGI
ncbi:MAG: hypothetical protein JST12_02230 [Armatimonadetes bacterium]|nr:hypothetical protein [Armatimonadota bacterium]